MGSSWEVGSSSMRTLGCMTIMEARFRSCFCPPESSLTFFLNHVCISKKLAISATLLLMVLLSSPRLSRPKASSCHTLSVTIWLSGFCCTKPISAAFLLSSIAEISCPSYRTSPSTCPYGVRFFLRWRSRVLLPQPDLPHRTTNSDWLTVKDTSSSALTSAVGYAKFKFLTCIVAI